VSAAAQPPPVPAGTIAALLDALARSNPGRLTTDYPGDAPAAQLLQLAYDTGLPARVVRTGLERLAWYRMAVRRPDGLWRECCNLRGGHGA
jgi:hypothetical protein